MTSQKLNIAIDGPAGAGKSTIAKYIAVNTGLVHLDTGLMYRAAAFLVLQHEINYKSNLGYLIEQLKSDKIKLKKDNHILKVYIDNLDMTSSLRLMPYISEITSEISKIPEIRQYMVAWQRKLARTYDIVMDGRDIGSNVLPNAQIKIFLTASINERTRRRLYQLNEMEIESNFSKLKEEINARDKGDYEREIDNLKIADGAIVIDNTGDSEEKTASIIINMIEKLNEKLYTR